MRSDAARPAVSACNSPFGTFYAPNISPDPNDGIGRWSEAAVRHRDAEGHVAVRPPLLSGVSVHLVPAHEARRRARYVCVHQDARRRCRARVRDHDLPFPFNIRRTLGGWKFLFLDGKAFAAGSVASTAADGIAAPICVNGPGHCAGVPFAAQHCSAASSSRQRFAGGPNPEGDGWVPNITQDGLQRLVRRGDRVRCSKPARTAITTLSVAAWARSSATPVS